MKNLWTYIENKNWHADTKYRVALLILGTLYALAGFAVWLIIRIWALSTWDWMVCFLGFVIMIFMMANAADNKASIYTT